MGWATKPGTETGDFTLDLLKSMESFEPYAKPDPVGIPTIGYGHALQSPAELAKYQDVELTEDEATELLKKDVAEHQAGALKDLKVPVSAEQMAAMTLLAFNAGPNSEGLKKIVALTNAGKPEEAAEVFLRYTKATDKRTGEKKELKGLVKRRGLESGLFLAGAQGLAAQSMDGPAMPTALAAGKANPSGPGVVGKSVGRPTSAVSNVGNAPTPQQAPSSAAQVEDSKTSQVSRVVTASTAAAARPPANTRQQAPMNTAPGGASAPGSGKRTGINEISLAVIKNGMLDGI